MPRIGKPELYAVFRLFLELHGWHEAASYNDVGGYFLDYLNGYRVEQVTNATGGVRTPFGERRHTILEMVSVMRFAIDVSTEMERERR